MALHAVLMSTAFQFSYIFCVCHQIQIQMYPAQLSILVTSWRHNMAPVQTRWVLGEYLICSGIFWLCSRSYPEFQALT